jgi:DNA polymerase-3 subunit gamma/tau
MAYTVLARRYRSGTFDEVVGQENVARTLKRAIESDRIAHAFLFTGTRGVGKTSMARIMAKALNCEKFDAPTATPCGKCKSCEAIARGDDMDVIEIDAASNTGVDNVREIIENSRFRPAKSRFKVYIIDEVHMLSKGAFNALLKTLEEPPEHVKFILATTETEKVPATILSRCQRYDFRNIPTREIASHLKEIVKTEKVKADDDALFLVAKAGAGSMRDALSLLDRLLSLGEKSLTVELIEQLLGMPKAQAIFELAQHIGEGEVKKTLESADKLIRDGLSAETLVASLADHFRNLLLIATCGADSELVEVAGELLKDLDAQAKSFDTIALSQSIAILEDLRRGLRQTSAGRAMLDATLVRLALADQFTKLETLLAGGEAGTSDAKKKKPEVAATDVSIDNDDQPPLEIRDREFSTETSSPPPIADEADALPAVGKVFDGERRSLGAIFASSRGLQPRMPSPEPSNVSTVDSGEFAPVMQRLRAAMRQHGSGYEGILVHGQIVALANGQATIRYSHQHEASARMLERNGKREAVQQVLSELINEPVGLTIEVEEEPEGESLVPVPPTSRVLQPRISARVAQEPPPPPAAPPLTAEQKQKILETDPFVRATVELFGGEIVKAD